MIHIATFHVHYAWFLVSEHFIVVITQPLSFISFSWSHCWCRCIGAPMDLTRWKEPSWDRSGEVTSTGSRPFDKFDKMEFPNKPKLKIQHREIIGLVHTNPASPSTPKFEFCMRTWTKIWNTMRRFHKRRRFVVWPHMVVPPDLGCGFGCSFHNSSPILSPFVPTRCGHQGMYRERLRFL